jgi:DNA-binding response OmpR family regulator
MDVQPTPLAVAVDPDQTILDLLAASLHGEGYRVETFTHGDDALVSITANLPDVLIVDVGLGANQPWPLLAALDDRDQSASTPVLLWSTDVIDWTVTNRLLPRRVETLEKPFDLDDLLSTIRRLVS